MYIFVSTGTRNARKKLEGISKPDSKTCLDSFFRTELDKLKTKPSVQEILTEVQNDNSKVHEFAKLLTHEGQQLNDFQEAIKLQAKSAGTNKQGLFNTLIFNSVKEKDLTDPNVLKALKPKLKAFLLAKKDADIVDDATSEDEKIANDDKNSRRKKHEDIFAKLKSSRLSNVLKVFMVLVLWDYIKIKEETAKQKVAKQAEEQERKRKEEKKKSQPKATTSENSQPAPQSTAADIPKTQAEKEDTSEGQTEEETGTKDKSKTYEEQKEDDKTKLQDETQRKKEEESQRKEEEEAKRKTAEELEKKRKEMAELKEELMPHIERYIEFRKKLDEYNAEYENCWKLLQPKSTTENIEKFTPSTGSPTEHMAFHHYFQKTGSNENMCTFSINKFSDFWESQLNDPKNLEELKDKAKKIRENSDKLDKNYTQPLVRAIKNLKEAVDKKGDDFIKHLRAALKKFGHVFITSEIVRHINKLIDMATSQMHTEGKKLLDKVEWDQYSVDWITKIYQQKKRDLEDIPEPLKQIIRRDSQGTAFIENYNFLKKVIKTYDSRFVANAESYLQKLEMAKNDFKTIKSPNDLDLDKISGLLCSLIDKTTDYIKKQMSSDELTLTIDNEQDRANYAGRVSQEQIDNAVKNPMEKTWHNERYYPLTSIYEKAGGAKVYIYWDDTEKRKVILKWFFEKHIKSFTDRLLALDSPSLPKIYEIIDIPESEYGKGQGMIMEYIEEYQEVSEYTLSVRKKPAELLRLCKETVEGIIALLKQNINPPEAKSGNHFIVDKARHVKFIDFDALNSKPYDWFDLCLSIIFEQSSSNCEALRKDIYEIFKEVNPKDKTGFEQMLAKISDLEKKYH